MPFSSPARIFMNKFFRSTDRSGLKTEGGKIRSLINEQTFESAMSVLESDLADYYKGESFREDMIKLMFNLGHLSASARVACAAMGDNDVKFINTLVENMHSRKTLVEVHSTPDYVTTMNPLEPRISRIIKSIKSITDRLDSRCEPCFLPVASGAAWVKALRALADSNFDLASQCGVKSVSRIDVTTIKTVVDALDSAYPSKGRGRPEWEKILLKKLRDIPQGKSAAEKETRRDIIRKGVRRRPFFWQEVLLMLEDLCKEASSLTSERSAKHLLRTHAEFIDASPLNRSALLSVTENAPVVGEGLSTETDQAIIDAQVDLQKSMAFSSDERHYTVNDRHHQLALLIHIMAYAGCEYDFTLDCDYHVVDKSTIYAPGVRATYGLVVPSSLHALGDFYKPRSQYTWRAVLPNVDYGKAEYFKWIDDLLSLTTRSKPMVISSTVKELATEANKGLKAMCDALDDALDNGDNGISLDEIEKKAQRKQVTYDRSLLCNIDKDKIAVICDTDDKAFADTRNLTLEFSQPVGFVDLPKEVSEMNREFMIVKRQFGKKQIVDSADIDSLASVYNAVTSSQPLAKNEISFEFSPAQMISEATADARNNLRRNPQGSPASLRLTELIPNLAYKGLDDYYLIQHNLGKYEIFIDGGFDLMNIEMNTFVTLGGMFAYGTYRGPNANQVKAAGYQAAAAQLMARANKEFVSAYSPSSLIIQNSDEVQVELKGPSTKYLYRIDEIDQMQELEIDESDIAYISNSNFASTAFEGGYFDAVRDMVEKGNIFHDTTGWGLLKKLAVAICAQVNNTYNQSVQERVKRIFQNQLTVQDRIDLRDPAKRKDVQNYIDSIAHKIEGVNSSDRLVAVVLLFMVVGILDIK